MKNVEQLFGSSGLKAKPVIVLFVVVVIVYSILTRTQVVKLTAINAPSPSVHVAIIGSSGYIGSRLLRHLQGKEKVTVVGYDRIFKGQASYEIPTRDLQSFQAVIYLGGLTGRVMCRDRPADIEQENIVDISTMAKRMLPSQLLIFASTSAIAEGSGSTPFSEDSPVQHHLFDSYVASLLRRENTLRELSISSKTIPQMVGLRFGTVIGLSSSQRIDLAHMALICQAFLGGQLSVTHPEANRALLWMEDLLRAVHVLLRHSEKAKRFDLFHLQSFSANIANIASAIGSRTSAYIHTSDHPIKDDSRGFTLNVTKFSTTFDFVFEGKQNEMISQLMDDVPRMCLGRESRIDNRSVPCVVCGSHVMETVLDLHTQPLANDFRTEAEKSMQCSRHPLRLVRCPQCHHTQLSYIVNRTYLFSHYLYQSGTSQSLKTYFEWLAGKVSDESEKGNGTVLEIACNDGTQLNQFAKRGWKTFGVDPASNLAEIARKQGHTVFTGFWGVDAFLQLPVPDSLDAIIAQNVLAHVEKPVDFLRACAARMSQRTKLYIQTSQCEMYDTGQFDTVYHEHVSFFTAHSFRKIADLADLRIINFEITPIHGRSCLVTFQRLDPSATAFRTARQKENTRSLESALEKERSLGMIDPWFYVKYQSQAQKMRQWIAHQLTVLHSQGHTIVAYGAAAKGMVLLHFLLEMPNRLWNISYVVDDAPLKQNTFCPGTTIPVRPTAELSKHAPTRPLTIIIFAWNFWDEISKKILQETVSKGISNTFVILPFPHQQLIKLDAKSNSILARNPYAHVPWPWIFPTPRRLVVLIAHFFSEEVLLPFWIRHHASMFDLAILIDYNSTDRSLEIIRREAPQSWRVVSSRNNQFAAIKVDEEVMDYEKLYPTAWKISLNIPEFLVHPNLRSMLSEPENAGDVMALCFRSIIMTGNDSIPFQRFTSLLKQRSQYVYNAASADELHGVTSYSRFIHRYQYAQYSNGRHSILNSVWKWAPIGFIAKYQYTPWPEILQRKLQIRTRIPADDFIVGRGVQHNTDASQLELRKQKVREMPQNDLQSFVAGSEELAMIHRVWKEVIDR